MAEDLLRLLEEERALLLAGDLAGLDALAPRRAAALATLEGRALEGRASDWTEALGRQLARNQAMLAAALDGVRDAGRRRAALEEARTRLSSYDAAGTRAATPVTPPRVERRA